MFHVSDDLGSKKQLFGTKVVVFAPGEERYIKTFKMNQYGLNSCQSYGNSDALLVNVVDASHAAFCNRTAIAY